MRIGQLIDSELKKQGFTQKELAEGIDKSTTAISQIVTGKYNPSPDTLGRICDFLNVDLSLSFEPR